MSIYVIAGIFMLISWFVGARLRNKFKEYSQVPVSSGLSGKEIAEKMLRDHDIRDVTVTSVEGHLTDHYNPLNKTINLSPDVFHGRSVAAAAVAAHETGHAVQHAHAYAWLQIRSTLVPVVSFTSNIVQWILLIGILTVQAFPAVLLVGIGIFALTVLFSLITLPVEMDASRRALVWLENKRMAVGQEHDKAKDALWWAGMTYVVSAIYSIAVLLNYVMIYMGGRRDD